MLSAVAVILGLVAVSFSILSIAVWAYYIAPYRRALGYSAQIHPLYGEFVRYTVAGILSWLAALLVIILRK